MGNQLKVWKNNKKEITHVECPICHLIEKTNPSTLTHVFDVRIIKGSRRWKKEVKRHYGSYHPTNDQHKAIEQIKKIKYGEEE